MAKDVVLPSGAKLHITQAPFADAKALYQVAFDEMKSVTINEMDAINSAKNALCTALSSKKIEAALSVCMARATYNGLKITDDIFENEDARQDYLPLCFEIASENIQPFTKALVSKYKSLIDLVLAKLRA